MYDIMIVDDSAEIRTGLSLKLDWSSCGFRILHEASNGQEALAKLQIRQVPVVVTDIRMPVMGGLELLQQCALHHPRTRTAVLSAYSDFPLIQTAIRQGAKDYLLKPVLKDELIAMLGRMKKELDEQRESVLLKIMQEPVSLIEAKELLHLYGMSDWAEPQTGFRFVTAEMRVPPARLVGSSSPGSSFKDAFHLLMLEIASQWDPDVAILRDPSQTDKVHFIVRQDGISNSGEAGRQGLHRFLHELRAKTADCLRLELVIGVSHPVQGIRGWKEGMESSLLSLSRSKPEPVSQTIYDDDREEGENMPNAVIRKFIYAVDQMNEPQSMQALEEIALIGRQSSVQSFSFFLVQLCLALDEWMHKHDLKEPNLQTMLWPYINTTWSYDTVERIAGSIRDVSRQVIASLQQQKMNGKEDPIAAIRKYICEHYADELSLAALAERYHYNAAYLSDLFKRTTGSTFSEYLQTVRLKHACELLKEPHLKIADVAQLTGFSSQAYFSSVFKGQYGLGPSEYRKPFLHAD